MSSDWLSRPTPAELEELFPLLASFLDQIPPGQQAKFLCKAFLLLAAAGNVADGRLALAEAAASQNVPGTSELAQQEAWEEL